MCRRLRSNAAETPRQRDIFLELVVNRDGLEANLESKMKRREVKRRGDRGRKGAPSRMQFLSLLEHTIYAICAVLGCIGGGQCTVWVGTKSHDTRTYTGIIRRRLYFIGKRRVKKNPGVYATNVPRRGMSSAAVAFSL